MAAKLWFDAYDFDRNEYGFTADELDTVRQLLSERKRVWLAPVVIEDEGQLETLYAFRGRCRTWRSGPEKRTVVLMPADEQIFMYLKGEMDASRKREERHRRCLIRGERNEYVFCPECYCCKECPFDMGGVARPGRTVSRDSLLESELEIAVDRDTPEERFQRQEMLSEIRELLRRKNERILRAFEMKLQGMEVKEIAEALGDTSRNVYYYLSEIRRIVREYREEARE